MTKKSFGYELLVDLYDCDPATIDDVNIGYKFLHEVVLLLGVEKMSPPFVFRAPEGYRNSGGISGWVPIIESGIQLHTITKKNFVSIDFYTCSVLTASMKNKLINFAKNTFRFKKIDSQLILRGLDYYK